MKNHKKNIFCIVFLIFILNISIVSVVNAAVLDIGEITSNPANPAPKSTATFSVDIGGEAPSEVWLTVEECNGDTGVCYADVQNVSMSESESVSDLYQTSVTLRHDNATYITCNVLVKSNGNWSNSSKRIDLSESNGNNNGNNNGNDEKSPGFELIIVLTAIGIGVFLLRRKRFR
jgi:hypothetical protein